jgi:hypothetical protein
MLLAAAGLLLVRSHAPHSRLQPHHDVAGFIYAGLAVLYAVLLGFVVITVWEQFNASHSRVHREADALGNLLHEAPGFPAPVQRAILESVRTYARAVVEHEWRTMAQGQESPAARQAYEGLWQTIRAVEPHTPVEVNWHAALLRSLATLSDNRRDRLADSRDELPVVLWAVLVGGAVINIAYTFLFGVRSFVVHLLITESLTAMTALLLFVILVMDLPFAGGVQVEPEPFVRQLHSVDQQLQQITAKDS